MGEGQQSLNEWAKRHQAFLELVYEHFAKTGSWPKVDALQRQRFRPGDESALRAITLALPRGVGWLDSHGGQVYLSFRGLSFCPSARPLLEAVVRAVQLAVDRFRGSDENPTIDSSDLPEQLGLDEATVQHVGLVIDNEPFLGIGLHSSGDGSWTWEIPLEITKFARVTTVEGYLKVQAQMLQLLATQVRKPAAICSAPFFP
jgi:hypothetical protein